MGEVAEMVLEGLLCESCGGLMDDLEAPGYTRQCDYCLEEED